MCLSLLVSDTLLVSHLWKSLWWAGSRRTCNAVNVVSVYCKSVEEGNAWAVLCLCYCYCGPFCREASYLSLLGWSYCDPLSCWGYFPPEGDNWWNTSSYLKGEGGRKGEWEMFTCPQAIYCELLIAPALIIWLVDKGGLLLFIFLLYLQLIHWMLHFPYHYHFRANLKSVKGAVHAQNGAQMLSSETLWWKLCILLHRWHCLAERLWIFFISVDQIRKWNLYMTSAWSNEGKLGATMFVCRTKAGYYLLNILIPSV